MTALAGPITLEVFSERGLLLRATGLDEVVLRRREDAHDPGSEVAVLRNHAPELLATCAHELRYRRGEAVERMSVPPGIAEVLDDRVTLLLTGGA